MFTNNNFTSRFVMKDMIGIIIALKLAFKVGPGPPALILATLKTARL